MQSTQKKARPVKSAVAKPGYIVSFRVDPNQEPHTCGYIPILHDAGQFYHGPIDKPGEWRALGSSPNPDGGKFPRKETFTVNLISHDNTMKLAWVVTYAPRPAKNYSKCHFTPFKHATLNNEDGKLVKASRKPDSNGDYHYTLTTQKMEKGGRFLFSIYATIISGNGKGKAFAVDPEMEVSEI